MQQAVWLFRTLVNWHPDFQVIITQLSPFHTQEFSHSTRLNGAQVCDLD